MNAEDVLKRKAERERKARKQAESILEQKSLELFQANQRLQSLNEELEEKVELRSKEIAESELRYRTLVETAQDIIYNISTDGYFNYINGMAKKLFGYEDKEVIDKHYLDFIPEEYKDKVHQFYVNFKDEQQSISYLEFPILDKNGHEKWIGQNVKRVKINGEIFFSAFARNITERIHSDRALAAAKQNLIKSETKYRSMIENMELGILEVDTEGIIINAYDYFCKMTGYSKDELIGNNANDLLLVPEFKEIMDSQIELRVKGDSQTYEIKLRRKDSSEIWVLISGAPFYDENGKIKGTAGIHFDITNRKNLQMELEKAKNDAEIAQKSEQQFLANMSHEIRTPLNAIIGMSHLLSETELNEEQQKLADIILNSSNLLLSLINDILDISKIDSGAMKVIYEDFNLQELLSSVQKTFDVKAREKNISVELEMPTEFNTYLKSDPLILNQIMMNLVGNAEKFTDEGEIIIKVIQLEEKKNKKRLEFSVSDTGIGISKKEIPSVFDKFSRSHDKSSYNRGGTGLGLSITQKLLFLLGTEINVKSRVGKGSTFTFDLWLTDTKKPLPSNLKKQDAWYIPSNLQRFNVLVAEDNSVNQQYMMLLLDKTDIQYQIVSDGQEAIEACEKTHFDLVLMDIQMPKVNGYQAAKHIRKSNKDQQSIIIALSAFSFTNIQKKKNQNIFDDYILKPFIPQELYSKIGSLLLDDIESIPQTTDEHQTDAFQWSPQLDTAFLSQMYGDEIDYARDIFSLFLRNTDEEYRLTETFFNEQKWTSMKDVFHKIKPTFKMVGLKEMSEFCSRIELLIDKSQPQAIETYEQFKHAYPKSMQLVRNEFQRIEEFLDQD